jgi:hypothetical protein
MKLLRLLVQSFAGVGSVDVEFGSGLNVLYGPNDLGKSTVAESIRFALLLPHSSTHFEPYIAWAGGGDPTVELTFETEAQRIWRVRKHFGKTGSSLLQESRNGIDFTDVERGRGVEGKLREILRWGIPEPGGAHAPRGLPTSFLATALLSTQADVSAILGQSLQNDLSGTGKEQIAAALQAVAQDPLFVELLRKTQERRSEAYTDSGAKKAAKGSVFKEAAERVKETRREKERLQALVDDSEGAEQQLREHNDRRASMQEQLAAAAANAVRLELLARQAGDRSAAEKQVRLAEEEVRRIKSCRTEVEQTEAKIVDLRSKVTGAREKAKKAQELQSQSANALVSAEEEARADGADPSSTQTNAQLRQTLAERAVHAALQGMDSILAAKKLFDATQAAELELQQQQVRAENARTKSSQAKEQENAADEELQRGVLLERALEIQASEKQVRSAQAAVDHKAGLSARVQEIAGERASLLEQRASLIVPSQSLLPSMNRLDTELASARGALDVGLVAIVTSHRPLDLTVERDGEGVDPRSVAKREEIEANTELEVDVPGVVNIRVRGGRREAQARFAALESRWKQEVTPHLEAASVSDLEGLSAKIREAQRVDAEIQQRDIELGSLQRQIAAQSGVEDALQQSAADLRARRAALGKMDIHTLLTDLTALGVDAAAKLERRRQQSLKGVDAARISGQAHKDHAVAEESARQLGLALQTAAAAWDSASRSFPEGVDAAMAAAQVEHAACVSSKQAIDLELASLAAQIEARKKRIETTLRDARKALEEARIKVVSAQEELETAMIDESAQSGRLIELRKVLDASDLVQAGERLREATEHYDALPVPQRLVSNDEVTATQSTVGAIESAIDTIEKEIHRAHGRLEQVGGAVAREHLSDAIEAFESAERQERETEAEYEAWKLLLEQMKEADAAQASNLGLALVPAVAEQFNKLTRERYETVSLTAQLETKGVVVAGGVRSTSWLSVGTREQLSTLFRMSLAEYLRTAIVLDDQLVQSDESRMDWFRTLLKDKAQLFQIIVFTCRPGDYLLKAALVPDGSAVHADMDGGLIRAIDLRRALHRRQM